MTGGARGIGLAIPAPLHQRGATVTIGDVEKRSGHSAVPVDSTGIIAVGPAVDAADAVILGTKLAAARLPPRRSGHTINIASASAVMPGIATTSATRHAVLGYTQRTGTT